MSGLHRVGDLEIDQDLDFERKAWVVHKIAWAVLALLLVATVLGLFGGRGVLSTATVQGPEGIAELRYERFLRLEATTELDLTFAPGAVREGEVRVFVSRPYIDDMTIERVTPEPREQIAGSDRVIYVFDADPGSGPKVTMLLRPSRPGRMRGTVGLAEGGRAGGSRAAAASSVTIGQFVYP